MAGKKERYDILSESVDSYVWAHSFEDAAKVAAAKFSDVMDSLEVFDVRLVRTFKLNEVRK